LPSKEDFRRYEKRVEFDDKVQAAARLIEQGIDPVGRPELVEIPRIRMKNEK